MQYSFFIRGQYPKGEDMVARFDDLTELSRLADRLGFTGICAGMHYAAHPLQMLQQIPFLCRIAAEAPNCRMIPGIVLLSLHKPLDIAEQLATLDVMTGGKLVFGAGLGYREVEFNGFGTSQAERGPRLEENLDAVLRLWQEDNVSIKGSHFELKDVTLSIKPVQKPNPFGSALMRMTPYAVQLDAAILGSLIPISAWQPSNASSISTGASLTDSTNPSPKSSH